MITIRRLTPGDAASFQSLRLNALIEAPASFASSYEEEKDLDLAIIEARLAVAPEHGVFGALAGEELVGVVGLLRETKRKRSHKAFAWGMYVVPGQRASGIGRMLMQEAIDLARAMPGVSQVNLAVTASNERAIRLYRSLGFEPFGQEPNALLADGRLHDELHMCLQLRKAAAAANQENTCHATSHSYGASAR